MIYLMIPLYEFWYIVNFSWDKTCKVVLMKITFNQPKLLPQTAGEDYNRTSFLDDELEGYTCS